MQLIRRLESRGTIVWLEWPEAIEYPRVGPSGSLGMMVGLSTYRLGPFNSTALFACAYAAVAIRALLLLLNPQVAENLAHSGHNHWRRLGSHARRVYRASVEADGLVPR